VHESEEHNGADSVYYIREPDGELIARVDNGSIAYYHFDALGSTRLLTDAMGTVTDTYAYDAWGNVMMHTGTTAQPYQFVGELGYYTHWQDENLALLQLGVRFYDPEIGRFGQRDPVVTAWRAVYAYAENLPTLRVDPTGLHSVKRCLELCHISFLADLQECKARYDKCIEFCSHFGPLFPVCAYLKCTSALTICLHKARVNNDWCKAWCLDPLQHDPCSQGTPGSFHHNPPRVEL